MPDPVVTPVCREIMKALDDNAEICCVWSGLGVGKTRAIPEIAFMLCHSRRTIDPVTGTLSPMRVLICAESITKLTQNVMLEAEAVYSGVGGAVFHGDVKYPRWEFANGSVVAFRGFQVYPSGRNSIDGQKHNVILSDETQELDSRWPNICTSRARLPNVNIATGQRYTGQSVWIGYPQADDRFLREAKARAARGTKVSFLYLRSNTNPWLPSDYEDRQKRNYATLAEWEAVCQIKPGLTFPARHSYYGDVVSTDDHRAGGSLITMPLNHAIDTTVSIDPGNESYSALFWQTHVIDGTAKAIIVDEWHADAMTTDRAAIDVILARGYALSLAVLDPFAGNQRSRHADAMTTVQLMRRAVGEAHADGRGGGLGCEVVATLPGERGSVKAGIDRTRARFCDVNGTRSILIRRELWDDPKSDRGLRFAVQNYAPDPATGEPLKRKGTASEAASHCADSLRYGIAGTSLWHAPPSDPGARAARQTPPRQHPPARWQRGGL